MSRLQSLKAFVNQRLTAAVDEIFGHFERTITEYEEELGRRRKPRDTQQLFVSDEEPPHEQQEPEPPHIKEEQWSSPEGEQLQRMEEAVVTNFSFTAVKSEDDEEKPQPSQLHQSQTEDNRETEPLTSSSAQHMETGADGEDGGGPQTDRSSHPHTQLGPGTVVKASCFSAPETEAVLNHVKKPFSFSDCAFVHKTPVRCPAGEKPLSCLVCKKSFSWRRQLKRHMRIHTEDRNSSEQRKESFICTECGRRFVCKTYLKGHMRIHAGEMTNRCSVCGKCFVLRSHLNEHMRSHTGERPYSCQVCHKLFRYSGNLWRHMKIHSRETLLRGGGTNTQDQNQPGT